MAAAVEEQLHLLKIAITRVRLVNYTNLASLTVLILDWLLMLKLEALLIWASPWSVMKALYLVTRYAPFPVVSFIMYHQFGYALSEHACKTAYDLGAWSFIVSTSLSESILTTRTWAVWGRRKLITYALLGAYSFVWLSIFTIAGFYLENTGHQVSPAPQLIGCLLDSAGLYLVPCFALVVLYDLGMLILMVTPGIRTVRIRGGSPLFKVVYRDGIIYYIYLFGLSLLNIIIISTLPRDLYVLLVIFEGVVHSVLACRVVLHIREQAHMQKILWSQREDETGDSLPLSPLRFRETQGVI